MQKLTLSILLALSSQFAGAFEREQILIFSRPARWMWMKQNEVDIVSSTRGLLATLSNSRQGTDIRYYFKLAPEQANLPQADESVFRTLENVRADKTVFGKIGVPQIGSLTRVEGFIYGVIWMSKVDLSPEDVLYVQTDDPKVAEEAYERFRNRTGVSGNYGTNFGGVFYPQLLDSAVLGGFDAFRGQILKVYDIDKTQFEGFSDVGKIYEVVYQLAYADLMKMFDPCDQTLTGKP